VVGLSLGGPKAAVVCLGTLADLSCDFVNDASLLLDAAARGDPLAAEKLLPLVYDELRNLAAAKLAHERPGQTLDATALVHEAYLKLVGSGPPPQWNDRAHFFRAAAEAMRRVLVDTARRRRSEKRGGARERVELAEPIDAQSLQGEDIVAVSDALQKLEQRDRTKAELVKLRYFAGLTLTEAAEVLGVSRATADRYWACAKVWLYRELDAGGGVTDS